MFTPPYDLTPDRFFRAMAPIALEVAARVPGLYPEVLLAQWADEASWSPLGCCQGVAGASGLFNFAGISQGGAILDYGSPYEFIDAYCEWIAPAPPAIDYYQAVRTAASVQAQAVALGASPWAGSHYNNSGGGPGSDLLAILNANAALIAQHLQAARTGLAAAAGVNISGWSPTP